MASAATVTLPTESVELISISCLKISCESFFVASSICACDGPGKTRENRKKKKNEKKVRLRRFKFSLLEQMKSAQREDRAERANRTANILLDKELCHKYMTV